MEQLSVENLVIGFGKAGKTLAADLAKAGQSVILVEQSEVMYGGTCINIGCIPSKKLLVEGLKGQNVADKVTVFNQSMTAKNGLIGKLRTANFAKLDSLENVRIITAKASFKDEHTVLLNGRDGEFEVRADKIFINTGASSNRLAIEGADSARIYDSTGILSLTERPDRLVIVGGGYISLEFAFMYQAFGSQVTILENGDTFLAREDRDMAEAMLDVLSRKGIQVHLGVQTERFVENADSTTVVTNQGEFAADAVLVASGRRANTEGLTLENADIKLNERGAIITDEQLRVAGKSHIWAMGDVAGSAQFTYISLDDYRIVRDQLFAEGKRSRDDRAVFPTAVFTEPPFAHIGLTESAAQKSGRNIIVKKMKAEMIPKAKVLGQTDGLLKAIIDADTDEILGVTLFCAEAHEIINLFKMAMDYKIPASYIKNQIFTHPTIIEGLNDLFA
ncbi:FAD-dependent oxidoreductase [Actinobacillus equuli]|uniref:FAD-dependent oxidoreductase n=1 Tax=Actinobacillus equuli TaxID=718 RepID=UPI002442FF58|nr:FAD-dependent oxidoreductase [Actinobacillus equuli]WGE46743.1 FAD-dependent oxidoreductase [Actinobacillus equuli subsp. haemolyticus]